MRQIWLLALNDLRLTARDKPAFIWMVVMPIAMMWFIGSLGGGGSGAPVISLGVVNHDDGWVSQVLLDELVDESIELRTMTPEEFAAAEDRVRTLIIPEGFTRGVLAGDQQVLRLEKEPDSNQQYGWAAQVHIVRGIVRVLPLLVEMKGDEAALDAGGARAAFERLADRPSLARLEVATAGRGKPVPSGFAQSVPGMLTMMVLMMTLIYGGVFLAHEKAEGMLRRQATLPMGRRRLLAGKLAGRLLLAGIQLTILVLAGRFLFDVSWGRSPVAMILMLTCYAAAVAGLTLLLGAVIRNAAQASAVGWIGSMVLAAVGGCWWPSEVMPGWLWTAAHVLPTAWAMDGFHALISFGQGLEAVLLPSVVLLAFGAAFSLLGVRFLRIEA